MKAQYLIFTISLVYSVSTYAQQNYYFPPTEGDEWESIAEEDLNWSADNLIELQNFLTESNSKAFLILHKGKIATESYHNEHEVDKVWYWASAGKSLMAFLSGVTIENGLIDINGKTSDYLGNNWTSCSLEDENRITFKNQLTMTTGLDYQNGLDCTQPECLSCLNAPNEEWYYHNAPYTLISSVLEAQHGTSITQYTNQTLQNKTGIAGAWIDLTNSRTFFSTPRSMARFGLLMLNKGVWNQDTILYDQDYFTEMTTPSQEINQAYGYLWWLNGQSSFRIPSTTQTFNGSLIPNAPNDAIMALGKNGQILIIVPSLDLVIVRMGDNPENSLISLTYTRQLWDHISKLDISTSNTNLEQENTITLYPNPTNDLLHLKSEDKILETSICTLDGQLKLIDSGNKLNLSKLNSGIYIIRGTTEKGVFSKKVIKI